MALIRQTDRRTGAACACEAEARWDPKRKQSRYGRRRLVGHVDLGTGEVVPNRPTRASAPSPASRRESCGACALLDAVADESGVAAAPGRALPGTWDQVPSLAHYMVCEGSAPLSRFPRYAATHGAPIATGAAGPGRRGGARRPLRLPGEEARGGRPAVLRHHVGIVALGGAGPGPAGPQQGPRTAPADEPRDAGGARQRHAAVLPQGRGQRRRRGHGEDAHEGHGPSLPGRVRLVTGRGFWSVANADAMMREHLEFLMGMPTSLRLFRDAVDAHAGELRGWGNYDPSTGLYGMRVAHGWDYEERRPRRGDVVRARRRSYVYLFFDASRAAEAERRLAALLRACASELAAGRRVEAHERHCDEYFEVVRGRPVGRDGAIAAATARAGYFAPFSSEVMGPFEALAACHDRDAIERRFGGARGLPDLSTPRVSAEGTLAGKPLVVFVALAPAAWLCRRMRGSGLDGGHAPGGFLDEAGATGRHAREGHRPRVCEVSGRQRDIFDRLGYGLPTTS